MKMRAATQATTTFLLVTSLILTTTTPTVTSTGVDGRRRGSRMLSADTISKKFFYNPPAGGAPPQDILDMLQSRKTSGAQNVFGSRTFVEPNDHALQATPYVTSDDFPVGHAPASYSEVFQNSKYDMSLTRVNDKDVMSYQTREMLKINTSSPSGILDQTEGFDDSMAVSKTDLPLEEEPSVPVSSASTISEFPESRHDVFSTNPNLGTETPTEVFATSFVFQDTDESSTVPAAMLALDGDLESNTSHQTKLPEEELLTTEKPVDMMTQDESEVEKTTLPSMIDVSQPREKEEEKDMHTVSAINSDNPEMKVSENQQQILETQRKNENPLEKVGENLQQQTSNAQEDTQNTTVNDSSVKELGTTYPKTGKREEAIPNNNNAKLQDEATGNKLNAIYFTVDENGGKDGHMRVKVGKALDHQSSHNVIQLKEDPKDVYQYHVQDPATGQYKFGYKGNSQWRHEERTPDGVVLGRYGWQDANGRDHTTHFVADAKGYRIVQPGQEITMHIPATTATNHAQQGVPAPASLTTVRPFFPRNPTSSPSSSTTATLPFTTSLSTTVTLSTQPLNVKPTSSPNPSVASSASPYPGSIEELVPPAELDVLTGRPPIAIPLPHQSISHRPGSWVFVAPTPLPSVSSTRPFVRPPIKPYRPYPIRHIVKPFRPVNRPRPRPNRPRPLKPLQPNLQTSSRPEEGSGEDETSAEQNENVIVNDPGVKNSTLQMDKNVIAQLQALLSNPSSEAQLPSVAPVSANVVSVSGAESEDKPSTSILSLDELSHFVNLLNTLRKPGQITTTSVGRPTLPESAWSSSAIKVPQTKPVNPSKPSFDLLPPPAPPSPSNTQEFAGSSVHEVYHDKDQPIQYPLDYAFMDDDYALLGLHPVLPNIQTNPDDAPGIIQNIPGAVKPLGEGFSKPSGNKGTSSEYLGTVAWKIPVLGPLEAETPTKVTTQEVDLTKGSELAMGDAQVSPSESLGTSDSQGITNQVQDNSSTVPTPAPSSTMPSKAPSVTNTAESLSTSEEDSSSVIPTTDSVWPYISSETSGSSTPTSNETTTLPPPPPPQSFWAEVLKRIYYWPKSGPEKRPTIQ